MTPTTATVLGGAGLFLGLLALVVAAVVVARSRRTVTEVAEQLARTEQSRTELDERLARLEQQVASPSALGSAETWVVPTPLTGTVHLPGETVEPSILTGGAVPTRLDGRLFVDVVVRESVVKGASLAYGLRHALSPATRNRIRFEMRREVKRSRKERRAEAKLALREFRARQRARMAADGDAGENVA